MRVKLFLLFFAEWSNELHTHTRAHIYIFIYRTETQLRAIHTDIPKRKEKSLGSKKSREGKNSVQKHVENEERKKERCSGEDTH